VQTSDSDGQMKATRRGALSTLLAVMGLAGCGGGPSVASVTGAISLDGSPLTNGSISFYPVAGGTDPATRSTGSTINADGTYRVEILPGRYRVEVTSSRVVGRRKTYADIPDSPLEDVLEEVVPSHYNTASTLTQDFDLDSKVVNFDLTTGPSAPPR
jgi:hypothetical protein